MHSTTSSAALVALSLSFLQLASAGTASFDFNNLPVTSENGQSGTNLCNTGDSQSSMCQTAVMNSLNDFCLWAPPTPNQQIGESERVEVAWCTQAGHGTRLIPQGVITGAHWLETPHYIQVTGVGDFTGINVQAGDYGGELDPHGADGNGNPIGGLVFSNGVQIHEWTSFIGASEFCFRICKDADDAWMWCQHIYDLQGCNWNEPGNYDAGTFDACQGDSTPLPPGIYVNGGVTSTFNQGDGPVYSTAPPGQAPGASSNCQNIATLGAALAALPSQSTTSSASRSSSLSSSVSSSASSSLSLTTSLSRTALSTKSSSKASTTGTGAVNAAASTTPSSSAKAAGAGTLAVNALGGLAGVGLVMMWA